MEIQFAKQSSCCHNKLNLSKVSRLAKNIDITLHELTETTSLRTVCSPYIAHLECLKWCRKLSGVVRIISGKRYSQIIAKTGIYQICLTFCSIQFQFFSTFQDLENQFFVFSPLFAAEVFNVLHTWSFNRRESKLSVCFTDHVHYIITDLHLLR